MKTIYKTLAVLMMMLISAPILASNPSSIEVKVNGLVCAFCAQGITKAFGQEQATDEVYVSLENQLVAIALKPDATMDDAQVEKTLVDAGYDVVSINRTERSLAMLRADIDAGVYQEATPADHHSGHEAAHQQAPHDHGAHGHDHTGQP